MTTGAPCPDCPLSESSLAQRAVLLSATSELDLACAMTLATAARVTRQAGFRDDPRLASASGSAVCSRQRARCAGCRSRRAERPRESRHERPTDRRLAAASVGCFPFGGAIVESTTSVPHCCRLYALLGRFCTPATGLQLAAYVQGCRTRRSPRPPPSAPGARPREDHPPVAEAVEETLAVFGWATAAWRAQGSFGASRDR